MRESTRTRLALDLYIQLGSGRSLATLHATIAADPTAHGFARSPALSTLERWSHALHWQDRVADLEREARRIEAAAQLQGMIERNQRHAEEGLALQQKGIARLHGLAADALTPNEAIRAIAEGVRLERLAVGEATERTDIHERSNPDDVLAEFTLTELRAIAAAAHAADDRPPQSRQPGGLDAGLPADPRPADGADSRPT